MPFSLAILTDEVSQDLSDVIRFAKEFDLDGIELRSLFGRAFIDLTAADLKIISAQTRDAGIRVSACASPVFKCNLGEPVEIAAHKELFKRSIEAAHLLDTGLVRVFTFLRRSHPATAGDLERAASHFHHLLELIHGTGIRIGVENEASCIVGSGREMQEFLSHLPADCRLGVVWDPCNVLYLDGSTDPVRDDFPLIASRVIDVHVKDAQRDGIRAAQTCVELGTGQVNFPAQLASLRALNYSGWITLETHWRDVSLDPALQHLPAGYAFSANAEPASRICMTHLQRFINQK
ncbi:MAG: Xylose isomerase domain protein barrel [Chthoniobacteraceae bacterium]|nr:Xylose isomerase domain protein barrel [Chthoniobacteraceae bacterium]